MDNQERVILSIKKSGLSDDGETEIWKVYKIDGNQYLGDIVWNIEKKTYGLKTEMDTMSFGYAIGPSGIQELLKFTLELNNLYWKKKKADAEKKELGTTGA